MGDQQELRQRVLPHFAQYPLADEKGRLLDLFARRCAGARGDFAGGKIAGAGASSLGEQCGWKAQA